MTRFDQDGDGDFDMDDVKIILGKKKVEQCVAITKSGNRCKRKGDLDENNLCFMHKKKE